MESQLHFLRITELITIGKSELMEVSFNQDPEVPIIQIHLPVTIQYMLL